MIGRAERLPAVGVFGRVFHCGPGDTERLRGHHRPGLLECAQGRRSGVPAALDGLACTGELVLEFLLPAEQVGAGHPDGVELQLGGVRRAAAELVQLAHHLEARSAAGHDEHGLSAVAEFFVDDGVDHVHVGDAAVADPHLVAVDDPVVAVPPGSGPQVAHIAAALRFGDGQRREFQVARRAEALRRPLQHLLRRCGLADRRQCERGHHDGQPDPRTAPEQLLHEHRQRQSGGVADQVAVEQRAVEAALGRLLEHRPRELLARVVVRGHRADHRFGELVRASGQIVLRPRRRQIEAHECTAAPRIDIPHPRLPRPIYGVGVPRDGQKSTVGGARRMLSYDAGATSPPLLDETIGDNLAKTVEAFGDRDARRRVCDRTPMDLRRVP